MPSESSTKSSQSPPHGGNKHGHLDREIKEMVSAITHHVTDFHNPGSTHHLENDNEHDMKIITLAGTNDGATLRSELDEKSGKGSHHHGEAEALSTFVNSNFQAINNSIMFGASYQANDPGVHLDISDYEPLHDHHKAEKHGKKEKKNEKEASKK